MLILCRVRVSLWEDQRPEVSWIGVGSQNKKFLYLARKAEHRGKKTDRISRRDLERVIREKPGIACWLWVQDDREEIRDGVPCRMGILHILDELTAELQAAECRMMALEEEAEI